MSKQTRLVLRLEVAKTFRDAMLERNLTVTAAAHQLGISRQSMHKYLKGSVTPRADVVSRACLRWNLTMNVYGQVLSAGGFGLPREPKLASPIQLTFSDMLQSLQDHNLDIRIIRAVGKSLELKVRIKFAS